MPTNEDEGDEENEESFKPATSGILYRKEYQNKVICKREDGSVTYEFCCKKCNQTYKNFYSKAAKDHDAICPLEKLYKKGIDVPSKEDLLQARILFSEHKDTNPIETITIE